MPVTPFTLSFKNNHTIYEKIIKCTIKSEELGHSYNPSLQASGSLLPFASKPSFNPYMTGVALYDNANNLLAVAKFGQPIPISGKTDFNVFIKMDM